jgi:hypothetical protein
VDQFDLSALTWMLSGAAPLKADLAAECGRRLGCEVVQGYGMTEASPVTHLTPPGAFRPGSAGITAPNTQTRIVDPARGVDQDAGQDGEIWVRGPQVMKGYLGNPQATADSIDPDGWLHTGDLGHIDADGHLYVTDRLKELIKGGRRNPCRLRYAAARCLRRPGTDPALCRLSGGWLQADPAAGGDRSDPEVGLREDLAPGAAGCRGRPGQPASRVRRTTDQLSAPAQNAPVRAARIPLV